MENKLYILCGIPFSGKSTLAQKIVSMLGFVRIDLDEIKFEIFGENITDDQIDQSGWDKVYQEIYRKIKQDLINGETVIYDTGNFTKHERELAKKIADDLGLVSITIYVDIPQEVARQRLLQNRQTKVRFDVSDTDFEGTIKEMEIPSPDETHLVYHGDEDVDVWINRYLKS